MENNDDEFFNKDKTDSQPNDRQTSKPINTPQVEKQLVDPFYTQHFKQQQAEQVDEEQVEQQQTGPVYTHQSEQQSEHHQPFDLNSIYAQQFQQQMFDPDYLQQSEYTPLDEYLINPEQTTTNINSQQSKTKKKRFNFSQLRKINIAGFFKSGKLRTQKAFIILCIICSGLVGFGGGLLALEVGSGNIPGLLAKSGDSVIYRTVETNSDSSDTDSTSLSINQIAELAADSVVEISTESTQFSYFGAQTATGAGSGVIISTDGYIITNNHVIDGASTITVTLHDNKSYTATLVATDSQTDIAVLKIDADDLTPVVIGDSSKLEVGDTAVAIGNPLGELGGSVTSGIISGLEREITLDSETMNLMQIDAAINPGNSGGGVFNDNGELVGIVVAKASSIDVEGIGFAIPVNDITDVIDQLIDYGYVKGRTSLGVTLINIDDSQTAMSYRVDKTGVYALQVTSGSNAEDAGIKAGDRIISVDGTEITTADQVVDLVSTHSVGDTLRIKVDRDGKTMTLSVTLNEDIPSNVSGTNTSL